MPIDTKRFYRPENMEQWPIHPLYTYAYITDSVEGLILVDVMNLVDGKPDNNFLKRDVTFNPDGVLAGALNLTIAGNYIYISCDAGPDGRHGMILVDVNVLVYAFRRDSAGHGDYRKWWTSVVGGDEAFGISDVVLSGFLRIVTHPKIFRPPT